MCSPTAVRPRRTRWRRATDRQRGWSEWSIRDRQESTLRPHPYSDASKPADPEAELPAFPLVQSGLSDWQGSTITVARAEGLFCGVVHDRRRQSYVVYRHAVMRSPMAVLTAVHHCRFLDPLPTYTAIYLHTCTTTTLLRYPPISITHQPDPAHLTFP